MIAANTVNYLKSVCYAGRAKFNSFIEHLNTQPGVKDTFEKLLQLQMELFGSVIVPGTLVLAREIKPEIEPDYQKIFDLLCS